MAARNHKATNTWVARIIPVILIGLVGYSAYVITKVVAIDYLINPSPDLLVQPRSGSAAAILLFYYLLLIPLLVCYARLIQTIITNPGYVPRSEAWYLQRKEEAAGKESFNRSHHGRRRSAPRSTEKPSPLPQSWPAGIQDLESGRSNHSSLTSTNKHASHYSHYRNQSTDLPFWQRDIFVCNPDGRPPFCSTCLTHKPDRTHHCSEVDRCVLKMDHFCPWVGGIVSETSFKFFIQFLVYAALFCIMVLTTIAVFIVERRRINTGFLDVHYYLILGLSALFLLFTLGMAGSSIQLALVNSTTVENLNRRSKVWFLAVLIPRTADGRLPAPPAPRQGATGTEPRFQTITYPRPAEEEQFLIHQAQNPGQTNLSPPSSTTNPATSQPQPRTFAILSTTPGENPFDIGPYDNIRQVMGYSVAEWISPIKQSPCADHRSRVSAFRMNDGLVRRLKEERGLVDVHAEGKRGEGSTARRSRRRGSVNGTGSGSGSAAEDYGSRRKRNRRKTRHHRRRSEGGNAPR